MGIAENLARLSPARLLAMSVQAVSMGGRLLFVSAAALFLSLDDLGRFGVLASLQVLLTALVGLEVYQTLNRELVKGLAGDEGRRNYLAFAVVGAVVAGTLALGILAAMRWRGWELVAGVAIVACEHFGSELFRMLVIEKKSNAALSSFSLRSGPWAIALPLLTLLGLLPRHWTPTLVLLSWAATSLAATLFVMVLQDRAVLRASLLGAAVGVPLALGGANLYGGAGIAGGLAIGAAVLWVGKALGVRKLVGWLATACA